MSGIRQGLALGAIPVVVGLLYLGLQVAFGDVEWDADAIRRGLDGLSLETTRAVLVGHAHYDHLADIPPVFVNAVLAAEDSRFWEDASYLPGTDASLLDWRSNPRAGLPTWLTVAAQKPPGTQLLA